MPFDWPPWGVMWALAAALFAACKLLTWAKTERQSASVGRQLAYLFGWPGLDAKAFLDPRPLPPDQKPKGGEWAFAAAKLGLGMALIWGAVPLVPADAPILRGWVGMAGLVFLLHFGTFHLMSCAWRTGGVDARPLMNWPILAESVTDFWGRRWNTAFRDLTHRFLFRPLSRRLGPRGGLAAGFLFSGVIHDFVISLPAGGGYGGPTLYFAFQGLALVGERSRLGKSLGLGGGWRGRAFTALVVIGPALMLFHPPFVLRVVLPFLQVLGAS
ncbi:MBOAT family protein [Limnoglobus roseus]|uniref:Wax synthase domain-containing protein n=1 Tax=Limnoglobus roseus TaxID=2598579 RepID=A0A5C1AIN8_9BACT|nr:MBOAT family protein [Limnoglobus roseus]QEL18017.1 hypothetical protein PX52LOC_05031 [Limnoglobus roseus]